MNKIQAIRADISKDVDLQEPRAVILGAALDALEKAAAFLNAKTVYFGTQDDRDRLKVVVDALAPFLEEAPSEPEAAPTPEPKRVHLPVIKES